MPPKRWTDEPHDGFVAWLRDVADRRGLSCDELVARSGLPGREFRRLIRGQWEPVDWMVAGLAQALDVPAVRVYLVCRLELVARIDRRWRQALDAQEALVILGRLPELVGNAGLSAIHEERLWWQPWRRPYESFEDYLVQRWGLDDSLAFKVRQAMWYSRPRYSPVVGKMVFDEAKFRALLDEG